MATSKTPDQTEAVVNAINQLTQHVRHNRVERAGLTDLTLAWYAASLEAKQEFLFQVLETAGAWNWQEGQ